MKHKETIKEFYANHGKEYPKAGQFNIYRREEFACDSTSLPPNRRDFYKISMTTKGTGVLSYADKAIKIDRPSITFLNPLIPYSWEPNSEDQAGYFCLFTEDFVNTTLKNESLSQSPLFKVGGNHVFFPSDESLKLLQNVFECMFREINSEYANKYDLLRSLCTNHYTRGDEDATARNILSARQCLRAYHHIVFRIVGATISH